MLFDVAEQRVGNMNLIAHPRNHGFDVGEQVSTQLLIVLQIEVVMRVDKAEQIIHQRVGVISIDGAGSNRLNSVARRY